MADKRLPEEGDRIAKLLARAGVASRREVERMIADAEAHASDDAAALDKARARNDLEGACYSARSTLSKHASDLDVSAAQSEVDDALKWLAENNDADADAVRKRQQAFDAIVHPVIASCYEAHKQEDDDATDDPSDDKFFDGDK